MKWLVILLALAGVAIAAPAIGFDHTTHARDVDVAAKPAVECVHCHDQKAGRLIGKPGHAACFGACHGPPPTAKTERTKLCANCHGDQPNKVAYPPYKQDRDFSILVGHKQHAAAPCTACHDLSAKQPPAPHARCISCHDGKKSFAMTDCNACHPAAVGKPQPPQLKHVQDTVTSIFSHATHAPRSKGDCTMCHAAIKQADENQIELPRPTANDCAKCHDGKQAFSVLVACTKCHDQPQDAFRVARPDRTFSHTGAHEAITTACATCHVLDAKTGDVSIAGHTACTSCHADDFGARWPQKCAACHASTEPWRKLRADAKPIARTEFGATLDHQKHDAKCEGCHSLTTATVQLRPARNHSACAGCHAKITGPVPHMGDCTACHQLGLANQRDVNMAKSAWSVRASFDHAKHTTAACTSCHTSLAGQLLALPTPAKATCAPCHDGTKAFNLTGTTCRKCHQ
ncbi:MAG: cytochrome c3 family protein [Kofleriaceae bacterium]